MEWSKGNKYCALIFWCFALIYSCRHDPSEVDELSTDLPVNPEYYAGGSTTVFAAHAGAYDLLIANGSQASQAMFNNGRALFHQEFVPYGMGEFDGLGPLFINTSCISCHQGNGRSQPPTTEIDYDSGLLMRFSLAGDGENGQPVPVPGYGNQLQTRSIDGTVPEAHFLFFYEIFNETYSDGSTVPMHQPYHQLIDTYTELPPGMLFTLRLGSPVYGLGLLEAVPEVDIVSREDETDENNDYISGRANYVWNALTQQIELGRFGWKSSNPTIEQQTASAFHDDMGVTSPGAFAAEVGYGQSNATIGFGPEPDVDSQMITDISNYLRLTAVPAPRNLEDPQVMRGRELFYEMNCVGCHTPQLTTGVSPIPELSNQTIYPYTDLLIHDMGEVLADGRPDFAASTNEWRTSPLWGIGLSLLVNPQARFLHDGRASSLEEAILWHGGEAYWAKEYFKSLPLTDRQALIKFLEAL
jgi:CxxC motif-containing protein (DUF1111 family)